MHEQGRPQVSIPCGRARWMESTHVMWISFGHERTWSFARFEVDTRRWVTNGSRATCPGPIYRHGVGRFEQISPEEWRALPASAIDPVSHNQHGLRLHNCSSSSSPWSSLRPRLLSPLPPSPTCPDSAAPFPSIWRQGTTDSLICLFLTRT